MVYRRILEWPDQRLKAVSRNSVPNDDVEIYRDLVDTFTVSGGYGLSAPQIGFNVRVIVINESLLKPGEGTSDKLLMINPKIISSNNKVSFKEACFSLPGSELNIDRFESIEVSWTNVDGLKSRGNFGSYGSACIQHEIDHLDGILTIDRLSQLRRSLFVKKYKKRKLLKSREAKSSQGKKKRKKKKR